MLKKNLSRLEFERMTFGPVPNLPSAAILLVFRYFVLSVLPVLAGSSRLNRMRFVVVLRLLLLPTLSGPTHPI